MKKLTLALAAFFALSGLVGCSSDSDTSPDTPTPPQKTDFTFEVTDLTQGSFGVKILPEEKDQTYYFNLVTKATFDAYADDLALQQADVLYMTDLATSLGIPLDQFLLEALLKGDQQMDYLALTPETDYVFYSYGISAEGQPLTGVNSYTFTTPAVEFMDVTFDITATDVTDTSFTLNITPDNDDCFYYYDVMPASTYEEYCGGSAANVPAFVESYLASLKEEVYSDYTMPQFVTALTRRGATSDSDNFSGLLPEYTYYAFAIGVANDGTIVTNATVVPVMTTESPKNEYSVDTQKISDVSYEATITASQSEAFAVLLERQYYFSESDSDADIINALYAANGNSFSNFLYAENAHVSFSRLIPDEDYYLLIFACNVDGSPKLDEGKINLKRVAVKTEPATQSKAVFRLSVSSVEKTSATLYVNADSEFSAETFMFNVLTEERYSQIKSQASYFYDSLDEALEEDMDNFIDEQLESWNASHPNALMDRKEYLSRVLLDGAGELTYFNLTELTAGTSYVVCLFGMKADGTYTTSAFTTEFQTVSDQASLASMTFEGTLTNNAGNKQTTYYVWSYPEGKSDLFYRKAFVTNDEWADKSAAEIAELLKDEFGSEYSNSLPITVSWGDTFYFYAVCYDTNGIPSDVYKITYTCPETGDSGTPKFDVTTVGSNAATTSVRLNAAGAGLTGPLARKTLRTPSPAKTLSAADLDRVMLRKIAIEQ